MADPASREPSCNPTTGSQHDSDAEERSSVVPTEELTFPIHEIRDSSSSDEAPEPRSTPQEDHAEKGGKIYGSDNASDDRSGSLTKAAPGAIGNGLATTEVSQVTAGSRHDSMGGKESKRRPLSMVSLEDVEVLDASAGSQPSPAPAQDHDSDYEFVEAPSGHGRIVRRTSDPRRTNSTSGNRELPNPTAPLEPPHAATVLPSQPETGAILYRHGRAPPAPPAPNNPLDQIREARFQLLNSFSKVTNLAKSTTSSILSHPLSTPFLPLLPPSIASLSSEYTRTRGRSGSLEAVLNEFGEAARAYVGQMLNNEVWTTEGTEGFEVVMCDHTRLSTAGIISERGQRYTTLTPEKWLEISQDNSSRLKIPLDKLREMVFFGGVDMDIRDAVWKWLLGYWDGRGKREDSVLKKTPPLSRYPSARNTKPNSPSSERSPVSPPSLTQALPMTPNDAPSNPDLETAVEYRKRRRDEYYHLMASWTSMISEHHLDPSSSSPTTTEVLDRLHRVVKDVMRTDRNIPFFSLDCPIDDDGLLDLGANTNAPNMEKLRDVLMSYTMYDWDLGYVQGMSDLCAPLLVAMRGDEAECFWCFVGIMRSMRGNFKSDQVQMHRKLTTLRQLIQYMDPELYVHFQRSDSLNMFFAFRWLLIAFKREFAFEEIMTLWEALWSNWLTSNFDLFVALSILDLRRDDIIGRLESFDEILKYVNELSGCLSVSRILRNAEVLFYQFQNKVKLVEQDLVTNPLSQSSSGSESENRPPIPPQPVQASQPGQSNAEDATPKRTKQSFKNRALEEELTITLKAAFLA